MAPGHSGAAVDVPDCADNREASPLKLGAEHIPFRCSLRELVLDRYAEPSSADDAAHAMQMEELLEYLKNADSFDLSPWAYVVGQTELMGDPAVPSREQAATLKWVGNALQLWEKQFPLEEPLAAEIRRLMPLSASLAIIDPIFLQPGAHPLHQLLDTIGDRAIGWQSRLDRVGNILQQQITKAVDQSRAWFENQSTDLVEISNEFSAAAERDQARAQRMVQRVVETELGKVKTTAAKHEAARMINAVLAKYSIPEDIAEFVKGPWYSSAQLLLLKFGVDSEQWQKMSATTETLFDSLQSLEGAEESRRQHIFAAVTQLPKEMRRWLLSLHHDTEAVNEAMGLVEFAHLRILRGQSLELQQIDPIVTDDEYASSGESQHSSSLKDWHEGQWFRVDNDEGILRAQLVLKVEHAQQLLFTNMAGIKVLQLSFAQFAELMRQGKVTPLYSGTSFSLCLASAVGIESDELLDALVNALGGEALEPESTPDTRPAPEPEPETESATATKAEPDSETALASEPEPEPAPEPESEPEPEPDPEARPQLTEEPPELEEELIIQEEYSLEDEPKASAEAPESSVNFLVDQAEEIKVRGGFLSAQTEDAEAGAESPADPGQDDETNADFLSAQAQDIKDGSAPLTRQADDSTEQEMIPTPEPDSAPERYIDLPMGAWLGFHDGETPLMARLAVHDPEDDYYIFVNRKGVKMRQVSKQELLDLIDNGMVDILETISNFREKVTEVRKNLDQ